MIQGLLIVNSSGGLIYHKLREKLLSEEKEKDQGGVLLVDKVIVLASTIFTGMELLIGLGKCPSAGNKFRKLVLTYERGMVTVLRSPTRLIFAVIHDSSTSHPDILQWVGRVYQKYVSEILYNPGYRIDDPIPSSAFSDVLPL